MRFVERMSYYSAETTRHMHISDEASIKDEEGEGRLGGGWQVIGTDCVLWPRHRVLLGKGEGEHMG